MSHDPLHLVCPHCQAINRVPAARLAQAPRCGACRETLFTGRPLELEEAGLLRHLQRSDLPLLLDCWAPWCAPCRGMAPQFAAAASHLEPRMRLAKLNTERAPALVSRFGIQSIPTLILFAGGEEIDRQSGAMPAARIIAWAEACLSRMAA